MLPTSSWCSAKNPTCPKPVAGVCKPMDSKTLGIYKTLQNHLNRVLFQMGKSTLGVDGRIGSQTTKAVNTVLGTKFSDCNQVAARADDLANQVGMLAESSGAPKSVPAPKPPAPPSVVTPGGQIAHPSPTQLRVAGFVSFIKSPLGLAVGIGTLAALFAISKDSKKRKR